MVWLYTTASYCNAYIKTLISLTFIGNDFFFLKVKLKNPKDTPQLISFKETGSTENYFLRNCTSKSLSLYTFEGHLKKIKTTENNNSRNETT